MTAFPRKWYPKFSSKKVTFDRFSVQIKKPTNLIPTWQDLEVLESMQATLSPLADFTDMLSGEERVTVSTIKPVMHILKTKVLSVSSSDTDLTADMKSKLLQYLQNKYSDHDIDELLSVCRFLDPRFKTKYIDSPAFVAMVKDHLAREGVELIPEDAPTAVQTQIEITEIQPCKRRKLGSWLKEGKRHST